MMTYLGYRCPLLSMSLKEAWFFSGHLGVSPCLSISDSRRFVRTVKGKGKETRDVKEAETASKNGKQIIQMHFDLHMTDVFLKNICKPKHTLSHRRILAFKGILYWSLSEQEQPIGWATSHGLCDVGLCKIFLWAGVNLCMVYVNEDNCKC